MRKKFKCTRVGLILCHLLREKNLIYPIKREKNIFCFDFQKFALFIESYSVCVFVRGEICSDRRRRMKFEAKKNSTERLVWVWLRKNTQLKKKIDQKSVFSVLKFFSYTKIELRTDTQQLELGVWNRKKEEEKKRKLQINRSQLRSKKDFFFS